MIKKLLFVASLVTLLMSSCNEKFTIDTQIESNIVGFRAYSAQSPITRAVEADLPVLKASGFSVYSRYSATGAALMDNVDVTFDAVNNKWEYSPVKYWPATGDLDFIAIGNNTTSNVTSMNGNMTAPVLTYSANVTPQTQEDLLIASALNQQTCIKRAW